MEENLKEEDIRREMGNIVREAHWLGSRVPDKERLRRFAINRLIDP